MGSFRNRFLVLIIGLVIVTQTVTLAAVLLSTRRTVEARAAEQLRAPFQCFPHPLIHPQHFFVPDQRTHLGLRQAGITDSQLASKLTQLFRKVLGDRALNEHPLHRHTHLAGMVETPFDQLGQGRLQVRIGGH